MEKYLSWPCITSPKQHKNTNILSICSQYYNQYKKTLCEYNKKHFNSNNIKQLFTMDIRDLLHVNIDIKHTYIRINIYLEQHDDILKSYWTLENYLSLNTAMYDGNNIRHLPRDYAAYKYIISKFKTKNTVSIPDHSDYMFNKKTYIGIKIFPKLLLKRQNIEIMINTGYLKYIPKKLADAASMLYIHNNNIKSIPKQICKIYFAFLIIDNNPISYIPKMNSEYVSAVLEHEHHLRISPVTNSITIGHVDKILSWPSVEDQLHKKLIIYIDWNKYPNNVNKEDVYSKIPDYLNKYIFKSNLLMREV